MSAPLTRGVLLGRAFRLRCPQCGGDKMFHHWVMMHPQCKACGLKYERDPGYFLGSIYINYGITAIVSTIVYISLRFGVGVSNWVILPSLLVWCITFPLIFFPFARAYWLAMDLSFDRHLTDDEWPEPPAGYEPPQS